MVVFKSPLSYRFKTYLGQLTLAATVVLTTNLSGIVVQATPNFLLSVGTAQALAQGNQVSEDEVKGYAASVLQMDGPRNEALNQIKALLSQANYDISQVDMTCPNTRSLNQLPRQVRNQVREIVVNYCNRARTIVEGNGLTVRRFNSITEAHQSDPALAERIRLVLVQQQQQPAQP